MLESEIIEERPAPEGSSCRFVAKKNGSPRFFLTAVPPQLNYCRLTR